MFVVPYTSPLYLFGKNFIASFEVEDNFSSYENTIFSGMVERGSFSVGDEVYVMNTNYRVLAHGFITELISYGESRTTAHSDSYVSSFEISANMPETNEPVFIIKTDSKHMKDLFIIMNRTEDGCLVDYAFDYKTAICKYLDFETSENDMENVWGTLTPAQVRNLISVLNTEGRELTYRDNKEVEILYLPEQ